MYVNTSKINTAIVFIKNGRTCGPERVYAELIKSGSKKLFKMMSKVGNQ